jgi:hypothetical protein
MTDERESWRKAFEALGPQQLRLRLEHRRGEYDGEYGREAERWLLEQDCQDCRPRVQTISDAPALGHSRRRHRHARGR